MNSSYNSTKKQNKTQPDYKMGRKPEKTFFPYKAYKWPTGIWKMLRISSHQRKENQNHSEISPDTSQNDYHQKEHK